MNDTLELTKRLNALEKEAGDIRKLLTKKSGLITDRLKTFSDVCEELGLDAAKVLPYPDPQSDEEHGINAFAKVQLIAKALNDGWEPNWNDEYEYKYYPWFDMRSAAGSGFSNSNYDNAAANTTVGSRLCFKTSDLAIYAGNQFEAEYKALFTFQ